MKPGKLITFEGGEGSGKSSILKKISEELQKEIFLLSSLENRVAQKYLKKFALLF